MGFLDGLIGNAGRVDSAAAQQEYAKLFVADEQVRAAYLLIRDMILFTDRRLILIDKQGITGQKVSYHSIPYRAIVHFTVETAGVFDLDAELTVWISGLAQPLLQKRFSKQVDVYEVQAILASFVAK
ncbi:PH domain-containing protein [Nocardia colli]|uniref:PH domain-containing protein n=1 Tax=Nocardia colli TaxID=2545717 RepID=A0A5N0DXM2_9NOCA|nr:PH domain-containing protein [Nocardia colli]KAA8881888.1 PH domain-containing protein [Nocardia colli]